MNNRISAAWPNVAAIHVFKFRIVLLTPTAESEGRRKRRTKKEEIRKRKKGEGRREKEKRRTRRLLVVFTLPQSSLAGRRRSCSGGLEVPTAGGSSLRLRGEGSVRPLAPPQRLL